MQRYHAAKLKKEHKIQTTLLGAGFSQTLSTTPARLGDDSGHDKPGLTPQDPPTSASPTPQPDTSEAPSLKTSYPSDPTAHADEYIHGPLISNQPATTQLSLRSPP